MLATPPQLTVREFSSKITTMYKRHISPPLRVIVDGLLAWINENNYYNSKEEG